MVPGETGGLTFLYMMCRRLPFKLAPIPKDYLWGGSRLNDDFHFNIPSAPFAEAWVCSTHPDGPSRLSSGEDLRDILAREPDWLGAHPLALTGGRPELPILVKLIDAKKDLSVQVHPDDDYSRRVEGQPGKTEMWYVLDAKPSATLIYGFRRNVSPEEVRKATETGTIGQLLNRVPVEKNDIFFIEPGTVHAIGEGTLIAEIQESSNVTYRLFDYGRLDKDGRERPLHVERALEVAKLEESGSPRQPMRVLRYRNGCASEMLARCRYFQVERLLLNTEVQRELVDFKTGTNSFHALLVINGCGSVSADGFAMNIFKGDCIFVLADCTPLKLHGKAELLNVSC